MASFPLLNRVQADDTQPDTGLIVVYSADGNQYGQTFYPSGTEYYIFTPKLIGLTETEKNSLQTFYVQNKNVAFDYSYQDYRFPSDTYTCFFLPPGLRFVRRPMGLYEAYVSFRGKLKP